MTDKQQVPERVWRITENGTLREWAEVGAHLYPTEEAIEYARVHPIDGSMTAEQVKRAVALAYARGIDIETAQESVYLRDRVAVHPIDDARVEEIRQQMLERRSALERDGDDYCIGPSALDDIDYLLSLLPQLSKRIAELEKRLKIPFGKLPCALCGGPHDFDTSVPSVIWNSVIRAKSLPDYLCATCIVREFVRQGQSFTAELWNEEFNGVPIEVVVNGQMIAAALESFKQKQA